MVENQPENKSETRPETPPETPAAPSPEAAPTEPLGQQPEPAPVAAPSVVSAPSPEPPPVTAPDAEAAPQPQSEAPAAEPAAPPGDAVPDAAEEEDIVAGPQSESAPDDQAKRFYCDVMLGKLARELRMRNIDVEYRRGVGGMRAYQTARHHGRVFLTRTGRMRELEAVFFLETSDTGEQLARVAEAFGLGPLPEVQPPPERPARAERPPRPAPQRAPAPPPEDRTGRCIECNVVLEKITRDQARPSIPFFIYQIHSDFTRCPRCKRVFWPGSHAQHMRQRTGPPRRQEPRAGQPAGTGEQPAGEGNGRRPRPRRFWRRRNANSPGRQEPQR